MEFVNHTPFGAAAFRGLDAQDREHDVVVVRAVYRLTPDWQLQGALPPKSNMVTLLVPQLIDVEAPGLITADQYHGELGNSSVHVESDLAPFKPRCDVIVSGHSHAPGGVPAAKWLTRLRVSQPSRHAQAQAAPRQLPWPEPVEDIDFATRLAWQEVQRQHIHDWLRAPSPEGRHMRELLLDKSLIVHSPRQFVRGLLGGWTLEALAPAPRVPLRWELAYGGRWQVPNPQHGQRADVPQHLLNEVCYLNPVGCGWMHQDLAQALKAARLPVPASFMAPQFEYADDAIARPITQPDLTPQEAGLSVAQMAQQATRYKHRPAGFGVVGRAWTPRIQHAGSYDQPWLEERWPNLPKDFDMGYWCTAPADQQIQFPRPDAYIELVNLADPQLCPSGHAVVMLPGHAATVVFRTASGLMLGGPCVIDTLHVDTDAMQLSVTWRASVLHAMQSRVAELRFEVDPNKSLFVAAPTAQAQQAQQARQAEPTDG